MRSRPRFLLPFASLMAILVLAGLAPVAGAANPKPASLKLISSTDHVTLERWGKRVYLDLGLWMTPVGGDLEIWASKPDYQSPVSARQVDPATRVTLRDIPSELLQDSWGGLKDFATISLTDASGVEVASVPIAFCPNSWDRNRLNDEGPRSSKYPTYCGSWSPFTRGMVWGLEEHWAAALMGSAEEGGFASVKVLPGEYQASVSISETWVDLFDIAPEHTSGEVGVTVVQAERSGCCRGGDDCCPVMGSGRKAEARPTQGVPTVTDPDPSTLPDLVALPLWQLWTRAGKGKDFLTFAATPWNEGPAPLWVEGFRAHGEKRMDAYQYFTDAEGEVTGRAPVGDLVFDEGRGHNHWHFTQFARYTLLDASNDEVVRSRKQTFCIAPTDAIDLTVPRASWTGYQEGFGTQCGSPGSLWVREVLQPGWGDTYYQSVAGQAFNITNVPNGWYWVIAEVDPENRIYQTDYTNDMESRLVYLGGKPGARRVKAAPWQGMEI